MVSNGWVDPETKQITSGLRAIHLPQGLYYDSHIKVTRVTDDYWGTVEMLAVG
jgi:hypothetical protein